MATDDNDDDEKEETYENKGSEPCPEDTYFQQELLWQKDCAREIEQGHMHGATTKIDKYKIISNILRMKFPRKILEEKVMENKVKFTPYMVRREIHGFKFIYFANERDLEEFGIDMVK